MNSTVTNYIFTNGDTVMRLILGRPGDECRREYDAVFDKSIESEDDSPVVIVRDAEPTVWIEDDIVFLLDRMTDDYGEWPAGLEDWWRGIENNPLDAGETICFESDDCTIKITADTTPMTGLRALSQDEF